MIENNQEYSVFEKALNIEEPWYVLEYEFNKPKKELHIFLDFKRGAKFLCPHCGHHQTKVHDILDDDRTWRHLNFWQYQTILHARMPRVKCELCGKIRTIHVDWSRSGSGFTWDFESEVLLLMKEMPVAAVARKVGEHDTRLWRVFHYYVEKAMSEMDFSNVKRVAIDETSSRRGHEYVTLFIDIDTKRVLFVTEGKDSSVLTTFSAFLKSKGINPSSIEEVCSDMSPAFQKGIEMDFPRAHITFDRFHVMKLVNEALDQVRRMEQSSEPTLKKTRYIWLKNQKNLTIDQQKTFLNLKDTNLKTARAYRIKLAIQNLWTRVTGARFYFNEWYEWAIRSQLSPMVKLAKTLKKHEKGILRWFVTKMTNGLLEGINSLVQAAKRKARGYRTTKNFVAMIYATANKLTINVQPHYA